MKTSTRKCLGVGLIAMSLVAFEALTMFGVGQGRLLESRSLSEPGSQWRATASQYEMHLPLWEKVGLIVVAGIGLSILLLPGRDKTSA